MLTAWGPAGGQRSPGHACSVQGAGAGRLRHSSSGALSGLVNAGRASPCVSSGALFSCSLCYPHLCMQPWQASSPLSPQSPFLGRKQVDLGHPRWPDAGLHGSAGCQQWSFMDPTNIYGAPPKCQAQCGGQRGLVIEHGSAWGPQSSDADTQETTHKSK